MEFWHKTITEKSFDFLRDLKKKYPFILIGGWAVFFYTKALKSKDIDIIVDYALLGRLKDEYHVTKNARLKKYEIKRNGVEVDIYLPHYSRLGVPIEMIQEHTLFKEGFRVPRPEMLLMLKQNAFRERKHSIKGEKDKIDIFSLLCNTEIDWMFYKSISEEARREHFFRELKDILESTHEVKELELSRFKIAKLKKRIFKDMTGKTS